MDAVVIIAIVAIAYIADQLFSGGGGGSAVDPLDAGATDTGTSAPISGAPTQFSSPFQTIFTGGDSLSTALTKFANAIQQFESGGNPNAIDVQDNNPGNLKNVGQSGAVGTDSRNGFAIFSSMADGFAALQKQITLDANRGLTISQFFAKYLGSSGPDYAPVNNSQGNSESYAQYVASALGVTTSTPVKTAIGG